MGEHLGEWHSLTVNDPTQTDDVMELEHPASCPRTPAAEDGFHGESYGCSITEETGMCGFENFKGPDGGPLAPGSYRVRFRAWSDYSYFYGTEEWDSCVEVERREPDAHTTEK
ncbi:hypothetical protein ACFW9I_02950 [[Kitasatospora] papulosa]|uniref:hypothetical protein n=1 Tax=[Kitasatospora] papulosa TaxID=1464011 RepID=UPI003692F67C